MRAALIAFGASVVATVVAPDERDVAKAAASRPSDPACAAEASWLEPATRRTIPADRLIERAAAAETVLLGEVHDDPDHHRWQLHTLAAIHGRRPGMVIGLEMLPRSAQPALDGWVAGALSEEAFLDAVKWTETWGFDPALYMPLFHFARLHRTPLVALNVERTLVRRVARDGWAAVPAAEREGVGDPATPIAAYRQSLANVFGLAAHGGGADATARNAPARGEADEAAKRVVRFTEAQLVWDRAMAEAIDDARLRHPGSIVVALAGRGHLEHRWGIPHQLAALGAPPAMVLLPVAEADACVLAEDLADAVFVLPRTLSE